MGCLPGLLHHVEVFIFNEFFRALLHFRNTLIAFQRSIHRPIWSKVGRGERLSLEDGLTMYATPELFSPVRIAHSVQQQISGHEEMA